MTETVVRTLAEDDWETYRDLRLQALQESPDAFTSEYDEEAEWSEAQWRERMARSSRLAAVNGDDKLGVVSIGHHEVLEEGVSEVFGLWVRPESRGTRVATELMDAGIAEARRIGLRQLVYWVDTDNGRAVAFASGYGFRTTAYRRTTRGSDGREVEEIALVMPLDDDPYGAPTA